MAASEYPASPGDHARILHSSDLHFKLPLVGHDDLQAPESLSPELVPIVTLMASQSHRRYHEGILMLYHDLNGDGKPADRLWREVYGILTGNQLAYWDAANLALFKDNPEALLDTSTKPNYLNFSDAELSAMRALPASQRNLENVIVVSTTLKNRFILQLKTIDDLSDWCAALRLANFEYNQLQEAYTGALLLARGARLLDIRTVLAEKRFDHEDWVSIRYGSGMPWKRCYAVVEPSSTKRSSFEAGRILLYDSEQKKKKQLLAIIANATLVSAIYPQSPLLIDHSTLLKIDAFINFSSPSHSKKKLASEFTPTAVFLMPEQHLAVPGFDTLIRFLIPLLDSFGLYGRPQRLKADRVDADSLLFGLPTLPHIHYLDISDMRLLVSKSPEFLSWDAKAWRGHIKNVLKEKLSRGYEGCGSQRGLTGAINSLNDPQPLPIPAVSGLSQFVAYREAQERNAGQPSPSIRPSQEPLQKLLQTQTQPHARRIPQQSFTSSANKAMPASLSADTRQLVQLAEIYNSYLDIHSPLDKFESGERDFKKLSLSADPVHMAINPHVYDRNDENLAGTSLTGYGILRLQLPANSAPYPADRDASNMSIHSPMTQYREFNQQVSRATGHSKQESKRNHEVSMYPGQQMENSANVNLAAPRQQPRQTALSKLGRIRGNPEPIPKSQPQLMTTANNHSVNAPMIHLQQPRNQSPLAPARHSSQQLSTNHNPNQYHSALDHQFMSQQNQPQNPGHGQPYLKAEHQARHHAQRQPQHQPHHHPRYQPQRHPQYQLQHRSQSQPQQQHQHQPQHPHQYTHHAPPHNQLPPVQPYYNIADNPVRTQHTGPPPARKPNQHQLLQNDSGKLRQGPGSLPGTILQRQINGPYVPFEGSAAPFVSVAGLVRSGVQGKDHPQSEA